MKKYLYAIVLILVLGFITYSPSLGNGFLWDDEEQIVNNAVIHDLRNLPVIFSGGAFYSGGTGKLLGVYYKPFMTLTFSLLYAGFGLNPFFYHLTSLIFHIANTFLVFLLMQRFLRFRTSLLLSLLFLVHPLLSEVVLYAADMQDLLYFFFGMLGVLIGGPISALLFLASLLSKETGIVCILLSILYSALYRRNNLRWAVGGGIIAIICYFLLRFGVAHIYSPDHTMAPISELPLLGRLAMMPSLITYYLTSFVFPTNLAMNQQWIIEHLTFSTFYLPVGLTILFVTALLYILWKYPHSRFFGLMIVLGALPHLQLFPLDVTASGRWMYVSFAGMLGMIGTLIDHSLSRRKAVIYGVIGMMILFFTIRTFIRTFDFADGYTLYSHDLSWDAKNFNLQNNLGVELYRMGRTGEAAEHFEQSIALNPRWWTNYNNLGAYWEQRGELEKAAPLYKKAIDNGNYYLAYENYAGILIKEKKYDEATVFIQEALRYFPQNERLLLYRQFLQRRN